MQSHRTADPKKTQNMSSVDSKHNKSRSQLAGLAQWSCRHVQAARLRDYSLICLAGRQRLNGSCMACQPAAAPC